MTLEDSSVPSMSKNAATPVPPEPTPRSSPAAGFLRSARSSSSRRTGAVTAGQCVSMK